MLSDDAKSAAIFKLGSQKIVISRENLNGTLSSLDSHAIECEEAQIEAIRCIAQRWDALPDNIRDAILTLVG